MRRLRGNLDIVLCERGIRTFEPATRNTLDISAVPVVRATSASVTVLRRSSGQTFASSPKPCAVFPRSSVASGRPSWHEVAEPPAASSVLPVSSRLHRVVDG